MGLIDRIALDHTITGQIIQLRSALQQANKKLEQRVRERTAELEEALSKLSELNQLKSNFVANISHELRTPLTHLKGYLGLLLTDNLGPLTDDQEQALSTIQRASIRLERLNEDLIFFSTTDGGQLNLQIQPLNLYDIFQTIINNIRVKASEIQVTIEIESSPDLPKVKADKEKISWVLYNC